MKTFVALVGLGAIAALGLAGCEGIQVQDTAVPIGVPTEANPPIEEATPPPGAEPASEESGGAPVWAWGEWVVRSPELAHPDCPGEVPAGTEAIEQIPVGATEGDVSSVFGAEPTYREGTAAAWKMGALGPGQEWYATFEFGSDNQASLRLVDLSLFDQGGTLINCTYSSDATPAN